MKSYLTDSLFFLQATEGTEHADGLQPAPGDRVRVTYRISYP